MPAKRKSPALKQKPAATGTLLVPEKLTPLVHYLRHEKVILDSDLAELYGVSTKRLNEAVKRNLDRFPPDFMFQLAENELESLRSQIATSKNAESSLRSQSAPLDSPRFLRSQIVTSKNAEPLLPIQSEIAESRGGRRTLPYAFTEQGVAMLSSVLRSPRAVEVNIAIMRTFVQLRRLMDSNARSPKKSKPLRKNTPNTTSISRSSSRPSNNSFPHPPHRLAKSVSTPPKPAPPRSLFLSAFQRFSISAFTS